MNVREPTHPRIRPARTTWAIALVLLCALRVSAISIVTILSSDAQPYIDAQNEIKRAAATHGDEYQSVQLSAVTVKKSLLSPDDIVIAIGSDATTWARDNAPGTGPVYYCTVPNAHDLGLDTAKRVCRGIVTDVPLSDQFDLIQKTLPDAHVVGMLYRSDLEQGRNAKTKLQAAMPAGWRLEAVAINDYDNKSKAIDALLGRPIDIVWTSPDSSVYDISMLKAVLLAALRKSVPVYGFSQPIVKSGGLIGTNINPASQGTSVAEMIKADLDASRSPSPPALVSEARPPKHEIIVNAIVARKLNITLPKSLLAEASQVYENE